MDICTRISVRMSQHCWGQAPEDKCQPCYPPRKSLNLFTVHSDTHRHQQKKKGGKKKRKTEQPYHQCLLAFKHPPNCK